jgi:hypothetical protein
MKPLENPVHRLAAPAIRPRRYDEAAKLRDEYRRLLLEEALHPQRSQRGGGGRGDAGGGGGGGSAGGGAGGKA